MHAAAQPPPPASRQIEGGGTPESAWQEWMDTVALPRWSLDQILHADQRLVMVAPHPDDEVLACGGLVASHVARGGACLVVAVTDGEASHAGSSLITPTALADTRRNESVQGLAKLGVPPAQVVRLGLPDGQVQQHTEPLAAALLNLLQPGDVVVTTWRYDGHPDHEATGQAVAEVCTAQSMRFLEAPVWMWHWARPDTAQVPWQRIVGFDLSTTTIELKRQALAAHTSQLTPRDGPDAEPVLGAAIQQRAMRRIELFFVEAG